jgi:hypothetical protein
MNRSRLSRRHLLRIAGGILAMTTPFAAAVADPVPPIEVNGAPLDAAGRRTLAQLEALIGTVPPGRYWYDAASGGAGVWGGPASAYLGPGLPLGGRLPAEASGGGTGRTTGVFVNGRELHPADVQGLRQVLGQVLPGRWWWDAAGNVGREGGPMVFNFYWEVQQRQRATASRSTYRSKGNGESTFVGQGCVAVHGRLRASDESSMTSYYSGC